MSDSESGSEFAKACRPTCDEPDPWPQPANSKKTVLKLPQAITKLKDDKLYALIKGRAKERYGDNAKEIQIEAVMNLTRGRNSFVLAGTGFGKTRIAEMYWDLFPKCNQAIVLCG
ncbi:hypothetical protein Pst134EA_032019 [Puccinia striiformis f. sp. tritici]|uniref:ATP-dependent DNA helicase sgs1 n=3 Tax=Puccinia striiformis TaxID=27350 RepID=A0A0L0VXF8_9BASI|nr:uncharacterized protein Pst134EA_032019 [Puccinia striiformis f. sp. tritici]KAH9444382.1 hypothetical protein Pst134EA_032019 [Puccinia striiformis f. sp. tritici]KNF03953.1 hypothetical protein PSTG_03038 [Puccinia striiformis f. sp. tritici PST-78]POW03926.1 hypothetical protein PSTT_10749 [Puccinia striiformis]POW13122.1 hypothetical protein PSHT_07840 [Puccinia striiformis]